MPSDRFAIVSCACQQVQCNGHPRSGERLCDLCQVLCQKPDFEHLSSGKVREVWRVPGR